MEIVSLPHHPNPTLTTTTNTTHMHTLHGLVKYTPWYAGTFVCSIEYRSRNRQENLYICACMYLCLDFWQRMNPVFCRSFDY